MVLLPRSCARALPLLSLVLAVTGACPSPVVEGEGEEGEGEGEGEDGEGEGEGDVDEFGDGGLGDDCAFNADCGEGLRCGCDGFCSCELGDRGTGENGVDVCTSGNDCRSSVCVEDSAGTSTCSGACVDDSDCAARLPVCADIALVGRICIRAGGA